jgi:hypothetical protein
MPRCDSALFFEKRLSGSIPALLRSSSAILKTPEF